jgi:hypothetical protein
MLTAFDIITWIEDQEARFNAGSPDFEDGADAIEALGWCRILGKALESLSGRLDPIALDQADRMPKNFSHKGFSWVKKEGAQRFKYDHIESIRELQESMKKEQEKAKFAAQLLMRGKALLKDGGIYLEETGELIVPAKMECGKASLTLEKS